MKKIKDNSNKAQNSNRYSLNNTNENENHAGA